MVCLSYRTNFDVIPLAATMSNNYEHDQGSIALIMPCKINSSRENGALNSKTIVMLS